MALPFYNQGDQDIYASGDHFVPQEQYRLNYTPSQIQASQIGNSGITNTQAAAPYIWPPQGGGGGGGGGGNEIEEDTFSMGMSPGALGGKLPGFGNWLKRTTGTLGDFYSKLPTPGNIAKKIYTGFNDWKTQQEEEEAERQAITRNRINQKIINTGIYKKKTYKPLGADRHPDDPTGGDVQAPTKTVHSGKPTGGHHQGGGGGIGSTASKQGGAPGTKGASSDWRAEGGRIGYNRGRVVNPGGYAGSLLDIFSEDDLWLLAKHKYDANEVATWKPRGRKDLLNVLRNPNYAQGGLIGYFDGGIARLL